MKAFRYAALLLAGIVTAPIVVHAGIPPQTLAYADLPPVILLQATLTDKQQTDLRDLVKEAFSTVGAFSDKERARITALSPDKRAKEAQAAQKKITAMEADYLKKADGITGGLIGAWHNPAKKAAIQNLANEYMGRLHLVQVQNQLNSGKQNPNGAAPAKSKTVGNLRNEFRSGVMKIVKGDR